VQVTGLSQRLSHVGVTEPVIGVSGGLDSTLSLIVTCKALDLLGVSRSKIQAITMPGFGTSARTLANARALMTTLGVTAKEIDIRDLCLQQLKAIHHAPFGIQIDTLTVDQLTTILRGLELDRLTDLVFENVQARVRTNLLMNHGFVVGTGDLSELALGWCTYNADHMSMYNPNACVPKTLVKFLVQWAATHEFDDPTRQILLDIVATDISPELLPLNDHGESPQSTEETIGPYELHDFFLYHFLRHGSAPEKILFLAANAQFHGQYSADDITKWLRVFVQRFFVNQFKRSALPDGPKVGSVSLSPRGDWRMPSDAVGQLWLDQLTDSYS
jgi:NAD+ synthase (glutamine-hydrolysing)